MKIMLLEDNLDMQQVLASVLELNGHEVIAGFNGQDGLRLLTQYSPDVIISDLQMPVMDGLTFLRHLQVENHWAHIPVIFISGNPLDREATLGSGAYAFITKPFKIENFNVVLQNLQT